MRATLRAKRFRWVGFVSFLLLAGLIFVLMVLYGPLTASSGYSQDVAFYVVGFSYLCFLLSLLGAIIFGILLCRTYELHALKSVDEWFRTKRGSPWQV
jgi:hypothetical protein